jgi:hypothetical protein
MAQVIIEDEHYGTLSYTTKTVSEAWEVGRVIMSNNPERVKSVEVIND